MNNLRATMKGQWCTNKDDLPKDYHEYREWNANYFISKAMTVGPNTVDVVKAILASRKLEVRTYRMYLGVLGFSKKCGRRVLEECCRQALEHGKTNYTYIKNSIQDVAEDIGTPEERAKLNEERNKGGYVMSADTMDINHLLSKSQKLAQETQKEGDE